MATGSEKVGAVIDLAEVVVDPEGLVTKPKNIGEAISAADSAKTVVKSVDTLTDEEREKQ